MTRHAPPMRAEETRTLRAVVEAEGCRLVGFARRSRHWVVVLALGEREFFYPAPQHLGQDRGRERAYRAGLRRLIRERTTECT